MFDARIRQIDLLCMEKTKDCIVPLYIIFAVTDINYIRTSAFMDG